MAEDRYEIHEGVCVSGGLSAVSKRAGDEGAPVDLLAKSKGRRRLWARGISYALIFVALFVWIFVTDSRAVALYDQGLQLTAAMRIAAGQVIHRDFYYNYGPAMVYMLAGLFKIFGQSVLVQESFWIANDALGGLGIFMLAKRLAGARWAAAALVVSVLWGESLGINTLLTVWSTWLLLPLFERRLHRSRGLAAGVLVALATYFRYDTGVGLAAVHVFTIAIAVWLTEANARDRLRAGVSALWPYLLGIAIPIAPLLIAYWATGTMRDFFYDIFGYSSKYYHAARNLPFPRIHRQNFEDSIVYILPVVIALGFYGAGRWWLNHRNGERRNQRVPEWVGAMIAFAALGVVMYLKGLVRVSAGEMYMALSPCILLLVVLCVHRSLFGRVERAVLRVVAILVVVAGILPAVGGFKYERQQRALLLDWILHPSTQNPQPPFDEWCRESNVISKGFCFFPDTDHMNAIHYIDAHTRPGDTLYVGLPQHQRIIVNDNLTYFAAQRLPATKWSHFDPFLQNRDDVQQEMVGELERNRPPLIVLDSEFENYREPNGSSVSTGVRLLDDYIAEHYVPEKTFGEMAILRRR